METKDKREIISIIKEIKHNRWVKFWETREDSIDI